MANCDAPDTMMYVGADLDVQALNMLQPEETRAVFLDPLTKITGGLSDYAKLHRNDVRAAYARTSSLVRPYNATRVSTLGELLLSRLHSEFGPAAHRVEHGDRATAGHRLSFKFRMAERSRRLDYWVTTLLRVLCAPHARMHVPLTRRVSTLVALGMNLQATSIVPTIELLHGTRCPSDIRIIVNKPNYNTWQRALRTLDADVGPPTPLASAYREEDTLGSGGASSHGHFVPVSFVARLRPKLLSWNSSQLCFQLRHAQSGF